MYNGKANVSLSKTQVPVFQLNAGHTGVTNKQIGIIYPNECYGTHRTETSLDYVVFLNGSGVVELGGFGTVEPEATFYTSRKSNGSTLSVNTPDSQGYYTHTLSKNMNWYIGTTKQSVALPKGTQVKIKDNTTGATYYTRIACSKAKRPTDSTFKELNPGGVFWVDFITTGSMPSTRSIW